MDSSTTNPQLNPSRDKPAPTAAAPSFTRGRGHEALRRGRWSAPGAEYFLTICTDKRAQGLDASPIATAILAEARRLTTEDHWNLRTAVVMPDHVHLLLALGDHVELSAAVRLLKGRLTPPFRSANVRWERGYFDHRLRPGEDRLSVFLYIFLNPYRANLLSTSDCWPAYYCAPEDWTWFEPLTNSSVPFPEWLL